MGARPTQTWINGERLEDVMIIEVDKDVQPGNYHLWVGCIIPKQLFVNQFMNQEVMNHYQTNKYTWLILRFCQMNDYCGG